MVKSREVSVANIEFQIPRYAEVWQDIGLGYVDYSLLLGIIKEQNSKKTSKKKKSVLKSLKNPPMKILYVIIIFTTLKYPLISLGLLIIINTYYILDFKRGTNKCRNVLNIYEEEILNYLANTFIVMVSSVEIFNYIKKNSYYFLTPSKSLAKSHELIGFTITSIIVLIIYLTKFNEHIIIYLICGVISTLISLSYAMKYQRPITDLTLTRGSLKPSVKQGVNHYSAFLDSEEWLKRKYKHNLI